jgi:hypothetical protein
MPRFTVPPNFAGTAGDDTIVGEDLNKFPAIGIDILTGGFIYTGSGEDTFTGNSTGGNGDVDGEGQGSGGNGGTGTGISNSGKLNAGLGNDTIAGTGKGGDGGNGRGGGDGELGIGIRNTGELDTGDGNDTITGIGIGGIGGTGLSGGFDAPGIGISNGGSISTGDGNDTITGTATGGSYFYPGTTYGIAGVGTIKTGDGNDFITATSTNNEVQQKVTIDGGINIDLGTGNDYFKGFGFGTVDGGEDFDTLDLSAFNRSELTFSGVISGNALKPANISFNNISYFDGEYVITLTTTGFENFIFADSSLDYSTLV